MIVGCVALGSPVCGDESNKASVRHTSPEGRSLITHLLSVNRFTFLQLTHINPVMVWYKAWNTVAMTSAQLFEVCYVGMCFRHDCVVSGVKNTR